MTTAHTALLHAGHLLDELEEADHPDYMPLFRLATALDAMEGVAAEYATQDGAMPRIAKRLADAHAHALATFKDACKVIEDEQREASANARYDRRLATFRTAGAA